MFIGGAFTTFYSGGVAQLPRPGKYQLRLSKNGIQLVPMFRAPNANKFIVPASNIKSATMDYEIKDKELSAGKAIAGGIIAGGVGAIAGASMGGKNVTPTLHINFIDDTGVEQVLSLEGSKAEDAHKKMSKVFGL